MTKTRNQPTEEQEVFGPYVVYERLGVGGMATVHRARERGIEGFERIVALKRLLPHLAEDASFVRSFVREAKLASMLQHAHIVQLYELGRVGHVLFISMEYIEGTDIRKVLRQARRVSGPPPVPVFLSLMSQLCDALDYAHSRTDEHGEPLGLVHRDVSPSNLLVTGAGNLKIIDFGIAKAQSAHLRTQTGRVKGKLAYMAPEALKGHDLDARSDIFSVGVIAHELLTARPLFACKNEYETLIRVQRAEVEPPSTINPKCPPELDRLVLKALARDPDQRWSSAYEMREAIERLRTQLGVSATNREVAAWMEWAFTLDAPATGAFQAATMAGDTFSTTLDSQSLERVTTSELVTPSSSSITGITGVTGPRRSVRMLSPMDVVSLPGVPSRKNDGVPLDESDRDGEEAAAEFAWGGLEGDKQSAPVVLDDIPDVSRKAGGGLQAAVPAGMDRERARSLPGPGVGAGMIETHRGRKKRTAIAAGLAALALCGVAAYVVLQARNQPETVLPGARMATLKFAIEPADAIIDVQGYDRHQGSPFALQVEAPGLYEVEIHREGYKSYVSALDVSDSGTYMVQVALTPGGSAKASLVVRSTPSGQEVALDGALIGESTPISREIEPGKHVLTIRDSESRELWRHEFEAKANTQYEFHPTLQQELEQVSQDERRSERRRKREAEQGPGALIASAVDLGADASRSAPAEEPAAAGATAEEPAADSADAPAQPASKDGGAHEGSAASTESEPAEGEATAPVERRAPEPARAAAVAAPQPSRRSGPLTVLPSQVKKLSGELPVISAREGAVPERSSAKLCIDSRGKVTSVELLTAMPRRAERELRDAFEDWRYTPYKQGGETVPVCFAMTFRVNMHR